MGKLMWQYLQDKAPEDLDQLEEATQDLPEEVKTSLMIKRAMKDGEFGPKVLLYSGSKQHFSTFCCCRQNFILDLIKTELDEHKATHDGFFITGFPRDVVQAQAFEDEVSTLG